MHADKEFGWVENNEMVQECIHGYYKLNIERRGRRESVWHNQIHKTCTKKAKLSVCVRINFESTTYINIPYLNTNKNIRKANKNKPIQLNCTPFEHIHHNY